jgi:hypothetical protein
MTDLETRVRDALRSDEIGWDDLRQPTLRTDAPRSPRRWPAVLATAAAVAVVATIAAVIATTRNGTSNAPAATQAAYAGYAWQLTEVTDRRSTVDVASVPAQIAFSNTAVSGTLADASIFGHYSPTPDGYVLTDIGFAGTATDIARSGDQRIGHDFASVFVHAKGRDLDPRRPASVVARVTGDRLVLQANGITLRLSRTGPSGLSPIIDAVGYSWHAVALTDSHGRLAVPTRLGAFIGFERTGLVSARDTVAPVSGRFGLTGTGYVVSDTAVGASGSIGNGGPTAARVRAAVDAMVASNAMVTATLNGRTLTLHRDGITLTLHRRQVVPQYRFTITEGAASATAESAPDTPLTGGNSVSVTP